MNKLPTVQDETFINFIADRISINSPEQLEERLDNIKKHNPCIYTILENSIIGINQKLNVNMDEKSRIHVLILINWLLVDIYDILEEQAILTMFERMKNKVLSQNN